MATQYIKNVKKHEKFFLQIMGSGGHGPFWPRDGNDHV